ncbi:MAG: B12-binding domain-containing radical SAM protein [Planctomycetes bacterium]|nr:B12-binding domain-containing radical SAM protein [Planctomycetota bacterium]
MEARDNRTVLLINPRATYVHQIAQKCYPPMHLLYLASSLRAAGLEPAVLDANAFRMTDQEIEDRLRSLHPVVAGLSVYSEILPQIRDLTRLVRGSLPGARIVLGGPHASAVPGETLEMFPDADYVLRGEAEDTLPQLCQAVLAGADVSGIPGIVCRRDGLAVEGPPPQLPDIHRLPLPARDLVQDAYRQGRYYSLMVRHSPVDTLFTSRGCPFRCGFCYSRPSHYRARAPEAVVDELVRICERGIRNIEICDDTVTAVRDRAHAIFDLIIREKLGVSFRIKSRVDVFTDDLARHARQAGVYLAAFGMESGSQRMLDAMQKKTTVQQNARACQLCRRYGILSHSSWIVGYPGETPDTVAETLDFIRANRPSTVNVGVLRPYPKTLAYEIAASTGALMGRWHPDEAQLPWVRLPWVRNLGQLHDVVRTMMRRIYFTPHYMASLAGEALRGANVRLARYAVQEALKVTGLVRRGPGKRARDGGKTPGQ